MQKVPVKISTLYASVFLFNPFTFTIGTRGNCEAVPCAVILWIVICLLQGRRLQAAVWFGFVVHFRIYPIIYSLPFVLFLNGASDSSKPLQRRLVSRESVKFGLTSGAVFLALTLGSYMLYGREFLNEALLYHLTRTDPRHNFSIYFYSIYLHQNRELTTPERLLSFAPQMLIQLVLAVFFNRDVPFCLFAQTVAFVAFNKVVTAQYFVWFLCLLPLVLPFTGMKLRWKGVGCMVIWTVAQVHWLAWAYLLEFKGRNVFFQLWLASLAFFLANVFVLAMFIYHHKPVEMFKLKAT